MLVEISPFTVKKKLHSMKILPPDSCLQSTLYQLVGCISSESGRLIRINNNDDDDDDGNDDNNNNTLTQYLSCFKLLLNNPLSEWFSIPYII
jgi:hypothetical protein